MREAALPSHQTGRSKNQEPIRTSMNQGEPARTPHLAQTGNAVGPPPTTAPRNGRRQLQSVQGGAIPLFNTCTFTARVVLHMYFATCILLYMFSATVHSERLLPPSVHPQSVLRTGRPRGRLIGTAFRLGMRQLLLQQPLNSL